MPSIQVLRQLLFYLSIVLFFAVGVRLAIQKLHRVYPRFFQYVLLEGFFLAILLSIGPGRTLYFWVWLAAQAVLWIFYFLVIIELYRSVLVQYPGLASFGRKVMAGALGVAILVTIATLRPDLAAAQAQTALAALMPYSFAIHRGVVSCVLVFIMLLTAFLAWFPVAIKRNVGLHTVNFFAYFLSCSVGLLIRNVTGREATIAVNVALMAVTDVSLLVWIVFLNRTGEAIQVKLRPARSPELEKKLLAQLSDVNATLSRSSRR